MRLVVYPIILKVANTSNRWFEIAGFQPSMGPLLKDQLKELVFASQASVLNVRIKGSWIQKANPELSDWKAVKDSIMQMKIKVAALCCTIKKQRVHPFVSRMFLILTFLTRVCLVEFGSEKNYRQSESSQFAGSGWVVGSNFHGHNATQKYSVIQVFVVKFGRSKFPQRFSVERTAVLRMKFPAVGGDHGGNKFFSLAAMPAEAEIYRRH